MVIIANFYLLNIAIIDELINHADITVKKSFFKTKITDNFKIFLTEKSKAFFEDEEFGDYYWQIIVFLKREKGIDLVSEEHKELSFLLTKKRKALHYFFTYEKMLHFEYKYNNTHFWPSELQEFCDDFSEREMRGTNYKMVETIHTLLKKMKQLKNDKEVMLLTLEVVPTPTIILL